MTVTASGAGLRTPNAVLIVLTGCAVALQIAYPLTHAAIRDDVTLAIVILFAVICVTHAALTRGRRRAGAVFGVTAGTGLLIEIVGVHTGWPFGSYRYATLRGPRFLDVPLVIALAWTMLCWPAALVARRAASSLAARVLLGAWATTVADVFLDPQMVANGAWTWRSTGPHLPGVPDIPLSNYLGWFVVTLVISLLVQLVMGDGGDALGVGLYLWFWVGWTLALGVFLGQPAAAFWGALIMGSVGVPVALNAWTRLTEYRHRERRFAVEPLNTATPRRLDNHPFPS